MVRYFTHNESVSRSKGILTGTTSAGLNPPISGIVYVSELDKVICVPIVDQVLVRALDSKDKMRGLSSVLAQGDASVGVQRKHKRVV